MNENENDVPRRPRQVPRDPSITEGGMVPCNAGYVFNGEVVARCRVLVWPERYQTRWRRRPGHAGKPHRFEWYGDER